MVEKLRQIQFSKFNWSILLIASVMILANIVGNGQGYFGSNIAINYFDIGTEQASLVLTQVSKYIPFEEDLVGAKVALAAEENKGFLANNQALATDKSKLEIEYTVQQGDNISNIAKKFNMHVASILQRNNIAADNSEKIAVGQTLTIPAQDTSDSQDWLAKVNEKKEQERQLALKQVQQKQKLASSRRSTVYRDRSSYDGSESGSWTVPISYSYISRGIQRGHAGIDMVADIGTPVYAAKAGRVVETTGSWGSGYGNSIVISHGAGQTSRYAHLSGFVVGGGETVGQGQLIGYSGNTGWSTGPHLHFEARQNGSAFNPF